MAAPFATAQAEAAALCGAGEGRVAQIVPLAQAVAPLPKLRREDYADGSTQAGLRSRCLWQRAPGRPACQCETASGPCSALRPR